MSVVRQAVKSRVGEDAVVKQMHPFSDVPVAGDNGGGPPVPFADNLVEIAGLFGSKPHQAEVVNDQEAWRNQPDQLLLQ